MLDILKMPGYETLNVTTDCNETPLHYLLGSESRCQTPLKVLEFMKQKKVEIDIKYGSKADLIKLYEKSKWYGSKKKAGPERSQVIQFLEQWWEEVYG